MGPGAEAWAASLARFKPLNLGIGGDQTQHVLWRIRHGELDGLQPRMLVLLIGTNNLGSGIWDPAATARGIETVLQEIRTRLPATHILHLAIFPRGEFADDPMRAKVAETNQLLAGLAIPQRTFVDMGSIFLDADGRISRALMDDFLHPTAAGYSRWAQRLESEF